MPGEKAGDPFEPVEPDEVAVIIEDEEDEEDEGATPVVPGIDTSHLRFADEALDPSVVGGDGEAIPQDLEGDAKRGPDVPVELELDLNDPNDPDVRRARALAALLEGPESPSSESDRFDADAAFAREADRSAIQSASFTPFADVADLAMSPQEAKAEFERGRGFLLEWCPRFAELPLFWDHLAPHIFRYELRDVLIDMHEDMEVRPSILLPGEDIFEALEKKRPENRNCYIILDEGQQAMNLAFEAGYADQLFSITVEPKRGTGIHGWALGRRGSSGRRGRLTLKKERLTNSPRGVHILRSLHFFEDKLHPQQVAIFRRAAAQCAMSEVSATNQWVLKKMLVPVLRGDMAWADFPAQAAGRYSGLEVDRLEVQRPWMLVKPKQGHITEIEGGASVVLNPKNWVDKYLEYFDGKLHLSAAGLSQLAHKRHLLASGESGPDQRIFTHLMHALDAGDHYNPPVDGVCSAYRSDGALIFAHQGAEVSRRVLDPRDPSIAGLVLDDTGSIGVTTGVGIHQQGMSQWIGHHAQQVRAWMAGR